MHTSRVFLSIITAAILAWAGEPFGYFAKSMQSENSASTVGYKESSRFPMHSVMKFPQALYVAAYLDSAKIDINTKVRVVKAELAQDTWSPMLKEMGDTAMVSYAEILRWSLVQSDNNASDLLFKFCGSPEKISRYMAKIGFKNVQVGATEAEMHADLAKSDLNWCTPKEMANLFEWFYKNKGKHPPMNDAGIVISPNGQATFIAVFVTEPTAPNQLAEIAREALEKLQTK